MKTRNAPVVAETVLKIRKIIESTPDARLPSVRNLARLCTVSLVTTIRAIAILKDEGVIESRWGSGNYVTRRKMPSPKLSADLPTGTVNKIALMLKNDIVEGKYPTHEPLPSIKQLSARYNASYPSIKKILGTLCDENILKRHGARYHFFTKRFTHRPKIVIVAFGLGRNAIRIDTERERNFYRFLSIAATNQNVILETVCYNDHREHPAFYCPGDAPLEQYLKGKGISGIILSSYHMKNSAECLRMLMRFDIPISAWVEDHRISEMIGRYSPGRKNLLFFDSSYSSVPGFEVGEYLIGKGHKNIAYLSLYHKNPWSQNRLKGLQKAAQHYPDVRVFPFVCTAYLNDYFFMLKVLKESLFDKHCSAARITRNLHPFLKSRISLVKMEHDVLLRDNLIFTECKKLIHKASNNSALSAWVCANDQIALLINDCWDHEAVPLAARPVLVGFDNSFTSLERNITSYEFNTYGEVQFMLNHLLYPSSTHMLHNKSAIRLSGRIVERGMY